MMIEGNGDNTKGKLQDISLGEEFQPHMTWVEAYLKVHKTDVGWEWEEIPVCRDESG